MKFQNINYNKPNSSVIAKKIVKLFEDELGLPANKWNGFFVRYSKDSVLEKFYNIINTTKFTEIYHKFIKRLTYKFKTPLLYQVKPTFRFQPHGYSGTPFHSDDLTSGHGPMIHNIWLPFVATNKFNTLYFVNEDISKEIKSEFKTKRQTIGKLNENALKFAYPVTCKSGEYLFFNNKCLHGGITNRSKQARFSIDFRICIPKYSIGRKSLGSEFRSTLQNNDSRKNVATYIYSIDKVAHFNHQTQRFIIKQFCLSNNYIVDYETAEFYSTEHYPMLNDLVTKKEYKIIVIFSKHCLSLNKNEIKKVYKIARLNKIKLIFALENEVF